MTKARNRTKSVTAKVKPSRRSDAEHSMRQQPIYARTDYRGADKLAGKIAIITGGDSGIGRAVAIAFANEAADVVVLYHENDTDADETRVLVEATGRRCLTIKGDIAAGTFCQNAVKKAYDVFRRIDILVNNAAEQHPVEKPEQITSKQLLRTFQTNVFGMFFLTNAALPHLRRQPGATIINTGSVVAYRGHDMLIDYTSTKGAVIGYTRAMALSLAPDIRVNAVAPGPIWTPLIPSTFPDEKVGNFGADTPIGRAGQPFECAGAYVFLASADATYITGQVIHPNGGEVVNA